MKRKLFVITGPTAIGKSDMAVRLALENNSEIISADSMQIYKQLNIGTGKITESEMRGVKHHMIDVAEPDEDYSVGRYVSEAESVISGLDKIPIITGGTGLYITSLINGSNFGFAGKDDNVRNKWNSIAEEKGKNYVYDYLMSIDPVSAEKINVNDVKRVIRAIEIFEITGIPKSRIVNENNTKYEAEIVILYDDREKMYEKINERVDKMFEAGLIEEVKNLLKYKECQSMQAIGYKETAEYLTGKLTLKETIQLVKQNSRNYAKRQMTYFNGMKITNKNFVRKDDFGTVRSLFHDFSLRNTTEA